MNWSWQLKHGRGSPLPGKSHYAFKEDLDKEVKELVSEGAKINGHLPRVLVTGALGRCGKGLI